MARLQIRAGRHRLWAALAGLCMAGLLGQALTAQETKDGLPKRAHVFVFPEKLTGKDELRDGKRGKPIPIASQTTLIWVDLMPDARFAHDTEYVLISAEGTRVVKGQWRPVLNGKEVLDQSKQRYQVDFPLDLSGK